MRVLVVLLLVVIALLVDRRGAARPTGRAGDAGRRSAPRPRCERRRDAIAAPGSRRSTSASRRPALPEPVVARARGVSEDVVVRQRRATSRSSPRCSTRRSSRVPEGPATLEIWASDHSCAPPAASEAARHRRRSPIDATPPTLEVLSKQHVARLGGSECLVYKVGADAIASGVQVGDALLRRHHRATSPIPRCARALFALPESLPNAPVVGDRDRRRRAIAAPSRSISSSSRARSPTRRSRSTTISCAGRCPICCARARHAGSGRSRRGLPHGEPRSAKVDRECASATSRRESDQTPHWQGSGSCACRTRRRSPSFADRRTYTHNGTVIDHQTHLGFDLASLKLAAVPAAAAGRVGLRRPARDLRHDGRPRPRPRALQRSTAT